MKKIILELKINVEDNLNNKLIELLGKNNLIKYEILKKSIDARKKNNILFLYKIRAYVNNPLNYNIEELKEETKLKVLKNKNELPIIIVGLGPSGLFSALELAKSNANVIVIERGKGVLERVKDVNLFNKTGVINNNSNISYGAGGAGTFSDGKLNSGIKNKDINYVLKTFHEFGAKEDILYDSMPHIGSDYLINVVLNMTNYLEQLGVKILYQHELIDLLFENNIVVGCKVKFDDQIINLPCSNIILASGHACFDTFLMYEKYFNMVPKAFSMGLRIEHPQKLINQIQYGDKYANVLGSANYKLNTKVLDRGVYTFCMCPGGEVVISSIDNNSICVNGMSYQKRNLENANSAILVDVKVSDYYKNNVLDGFRFRNYYEKKTFELTNKMYAPVQLLKDFLNNKATTKIKSVNPSVKPGYVLSDLNLCLPNFVSEAIKKGIYDFDKKMKGFLFDDAVLTGIEARSSSPVRILRDENFCSNIKNVFPCGEGCGYAGGITSAACDGIKVARKIIDILNEE